MGIFSGLHDLLQGGGKALGEIVNPILDPIHFALKDDPVKAIAQIAAITASGGAYAWTLPLIEGADVAQNGGDIEKVLEAAAKVYVAQQIGSMAGEYAGTATQTATGSEVAASVIGSTVGSASAGVILGQDPIEALKKGGISAAIGAGLGQIESQTAGFKLPDSAKAVINAGFTAAITDGEITPQTLTSALVQATVTADIVGKYIGQKGTAGPKGYTQKSYLNDTQIAIVTDAVTAASKAAFSGGNVAQSVVNSITNQGFKELSTSLDNLIKTGNIKGVRDSYDVLKVSASSITNESTSLKQNIDEHNKLISEINPRFTERDKLYNAMESARVNDDRDPTVDTRTTLNNAITAYNDYATQLNADYYNNYQTKIDDYKFKIDKSRLDITEFENTYEKQYNKLVASADKLDEDALPVYSETEKIFTLGMDENFNPDEYAFLNNLSEDQDPYYHWLTIGKNDGLHTNAKSYQNEYDQVSLNVATNALSAAGLKVTDLNKEQTKFVSETMQNTYGTNINDLKNADVNELGSTFGKKYLNDTFKKVDVSPDQQVFNAEQVNNSSLETLKEYIKVINPIKSAEAAVEDPWNVKKLDVATQTGIAEGNYVEGLDGWKEIQPTLQWDNKYGQIVSKKFQAPIGNTPGYYLIRDQDGTILPGSAQEIISPTVFYDGTKNAADYKEYLAGLGLESVNPGSQKSSGLDSEGRPILYITPSFVVDPTATEAESTIYGLPQNEANVTVVNPYHTLAGQFASKPKSAVQTTAGLSQDVKDTINEQVGLNVYDFSQALGKYSKAVGSEEIYDSIGTEITQADIDALNATMSGMGGQESDGAEGSDVVQDTTGVGDYLGSIDDYQSQINDLKGEITGTKGTVGEQTGTTTGQENSISEYLDTVGGLQDELSGLKNTKGGLEGEIEGLEGTVGEQSGKITGLEDYIGGTQQKFKQAGAMQQLEALLQPTIMEPVEKDDEELGLITPYDFSSIFATPEEEDRLISPYDKNEELLKLIKGTT